MVLTGNCVTVTVKGVSVVVETFTRGSCQELPWACSLSASGFYVSNKTPVFVPSNLLDPAPSAAYILAPCRKPMYTQHTALKSVSRAAAVGGSEDGHWEDKRNDEGGRKSTLSQQTSVWVWQNHTVNSSVCVRLLRQTLAADDRSHLLVSLWPAERQRQTFMDLLKRRSERERGVSPEFLCRDSNWRNSGPHQLAALQLTSLFSFVTHHSTCLGDLVLCAFWGQRGIKWLDVKSSPVVSHGKKKTQEEELKPAAL